MPRLSLADVEPELIVRQSGIRHAFEIGLMPLSEVVSQYELWRDYHEGVLVYEYDFTAGSGQYIGIEARKRGNKVHEWWVQRRLGPIMAYSNLLDFDLFVDDSDGAGTILNSSTSHAWTNTLLITLEYDFNRFGVRDSWVSVGSDLNRFFANLRKHYGKFSYLRTYETHKSGVCHVHMVIIFKESRFRVFKFRKLLSSGDYSRWRYRVDAALAIKYMWSRSGSVLGFCDVEAVRSMRAGIRYVVKYVMKSNLEYGKVIDVDKPMHTFNHAVQWCFGKRAFAVSGDFASVLDAYRRDYAKHNSNLPWKVTTPDGEVLYHKTVVLESGLSEIHVLRYYYVGAVPWSEVMRCSEYTGAHYPMIIQGLDLSQLSAPVADRLALAIDEIGRMLSDVSIMRKSVRYPDLYVCVHCREYTGDRFAVRFHQSKCRIIGERRSLREFVVDGSMLEAFY